jgi:hypothetical protein
MAPNLFWGQFTPTPSVARVQFPGVDIFAEAGSFEPLVKEFVYVSKGPQMVIELVNIKGTALVNGIQVFSASVTPIRMPLPLPHCSHGTLFSLHTLEPRNAYYCLIGGLIELMIAG